MKMTTKSLLSSLVAALVNAAPTTRRIVPMRREQQYEKVLEKHDRKGELRAAVLGVRPLEFRASERRASLSRLVRMYGFTDEKAYYRALIAKIREELRHRGWTMQRIQQFETMQLGRVAAR